MTNAFEYVFPAIRGIQAGREYYVSQCPLRLLPKIFVFDEEEEELPPEIRAQRSLNKGRLPEIARYITDNPDSYVFSAITASIDADVRFDPVAGDTEASRVGTLHVPMDARFIINDGQHRRGAIRLALEQKPSLGDETIAVVFFMDLGLERCQQMFADLNRHAVRPSASLGVLYDYRDPIALVARETVTSLPLFHDVVERERSNLSPRSKRLFTLSAIFTATRALFDGAHDRDPEELVSTCKAFWEGVAEGFPDWHLVQQRKLSAGEVRQDAIHSHGIVLHALGKVGNAVLRGDADPDWKELGTRLSEIDWSRRNAALWEGRAMIGGRVSKASHNVTLTVNAIKQHLGLELSADEQHVEDAFHRGEYADD